MSDTNPKPVDEFLRATFGAEIKPGREDRILQEDHGLAGRVAKMLDAEPPADGVLAPITHAIPTSIAPVKYILHVWTYKCSMCQSEHKHSEVFALNHLKPRMGAGTWVRNMTPVSRLEWNVPLDVIPITTRVTAGCFECLEALRETILPSLPSPPVPLATLSSAPSRAEAKTPGSKRTPTIDDFV